MAVAQHDGSQGITDVSWYAFVCFYTAAVTTMLLLSDRSMLKLSWFVAIILAESSRLHWVFVFLMASVTCHYMVCCYMLLHGMVIWVVWLHGMVTWASVTCYYMVCGYMLLHDLLWCRLLTSDFCSDL